MVDIMLHQYMTSSMRRVLLVKKVPLEVVVLRVLFIHQLKVVGSRSTKDLRTMRVSVHLVTITKVFFSGMQIKLVMVMQSPELSLVVLLHM